MNKIKLVCFDVDGTIVEESSWLTLTKNLGCSEEKHLKLLSDAQNGKMTFCEAEKELAKLYLCSGKTNEDTIRKIFSDINPKKEAIEIVDYLKNKDYLVYLISGAIELYVAMIANKLGVDGFFASSRLEFDPKGNLKKIHYQAQQGKVKLEQLKKLANDRNVIIQEIVFVGDSENDIEVFRATGNGIATLPADDKLTRVAWKTVNSLCDIKKIL